MTLPLALILFGALMLYCGLKGKSLSAALTGHSVDKASGSLVNTSGSGSAGASSSASGTTSTGGAGGVIVTPHGRAPL